LHHYLSDALDGRCVPYLSNRQREVLTRLAQGKDPKHIASEFGLAPTTVHEYIKGIYKALRVNSRTSCLLAARELGLIEV
jgi:two-component system nitrate/nitrite response regulator NarL